MRANASISSLRATAGTLALAFLMALALPSDAREPVGTAFTYQGELAAAGAPAAGIFDIRFRLFDSPSDGNQIGSTLCANDLFIENGRFAALLDFGSMFTGQKRFLEMEVRQDAGSDCSDTTGYVLLTPRQELTAAPNATFSQTAATAATAANAASLNGQSPSFYQNAANLTGTISDSRLSGNVARLDGIQTFTGQTNFSNPANTFSGIFTGSGAALTSLNGASINAGTLARSSLSVDVQTGVGKLVSDVSLVRSVATPSCTPISIAVSGSFAYLLTSVNLQIFNISDPAAPTLVGSVGTGEGYPVSIAVSGSFAYVVDQNLNTLQVYNISNTAAPTLVGSVETGSQPISVAVSGSFAYVVNSYSRTLQIFDISNPAAPTLAGSVATGSQPSSVAVSGSFAYVTNAGSRRLQVFNISNAATPMLAGSVATGSQPSSVAVSGSFAYVVSYFWDMLQVFDISTPDAPTLAGSVPTAELPYSVALSGSFAFVTGMGSNTLQVFDISNPAAIMLAGSVATDFRPVSIAVSGSYAYVGNDDASTMQVFKVLGVGFGTSLAASSLTGVNGSGLTGVNATKLNGQDASFYTSASNIATGTLDNARTTGTALNTPTTLVLRDASGNFAAGTITANLSGNSTTATTATTAATATNATQLNGQAASFYTSASNITTGTLATAQVPNLDAAKITSGVLAPALIPNLNASKITTGTLANAQTTGTSLNTPSTLVLRDGSGNFSAGTITAALNGNATTATNATLLNGQPASFYTSASNMNTGTLADGLLSSNIPRLNANNTFAGDTTFANKIRVNNGVITDGANAVGTADLGLYSQRPGFFLRFVSSGGGFVWYTDGATTPAGGSARMQLTSAGNLSVTGSLSKGGGSFKIDHPLDPTNKYLYHSFVESPDMMNVYNGNITTDASGYATITMPDYFEALNRDFRYQLTVLDPTSFALVRVSRELGGNSFDIASNLPNIKVSWQVTGIRHDAWAEKNRIPNSVDKVGAEKGTYLHPDAFTEPVEATQQNPAAASH